MIQSTSCTDNPGHLHLAIIMDGNGRWATAQGLSRSAGHRAGADAVRRVVKAAPALGVGTLTLYAFSADNWKRPAAEVNALMRLFREYLRRETPRCVAHRIRLSVIGRRDRLPMPLRASIATAEAATADGRAMHLRIAVDYSAQDAIVRAAAGLAHEPVPTRERFARLLAEVDHAREASPNVDLLIRTGGERRLSDFLLWECAYAELCFSDRMWPEFGADDLAAAVEDFHRRERRFGGLPAGQVDVDDSRALPDLRAI